MRRPLRLHRRPETTWLTALILLMVSQGLSRAAEPERPAPSVAENGDRSIAFEPAPDSFPALLTVTGPLGIQVVRILNPGERFVLEAVDGRGNPFPDGDYVWEFRQVASVAPGSSPASSGRTAQPESQMGRFRIENARVAFTTRPASAGAVAAPVPDQVINDDLIVTASECVGFDCVNGESFGYDTIRLKENNLRIHFEDTSTAASYPTNDWAIEVNSQLNGGGSYFAVRDRNTDRLVMQVDAGAPANALRVDSDGDLGVRTATPVLDVHAKASDSPGLRLEQDSTAGWTPQTWDVAGNEANFFVRDVTGGSRLPFRIRPGAPSNSVYIAASGNVGINTSSPSETLHVSGGTLLDGTLSFTAGAAPPTPASCSMTVFYQTGDHLRFKFDDGSQPFRVVAGNLTAGGGAAIDGMLRMLWNTGAPTPAAGTAFVWHDSSDGSVKFRFSSGTPAQLTSAGVWTDASSRAFKNNIQLLSTSDAMAALQKLTPVRFYVNGSTDEQVGFIAEDVPALVATEGRQGVAPMDVVGVLAKVVQEQQAQLQQLAGEVAALRAALERVQPVRQR